jgi:hypothetical protein
MQKPFGIVPELAAAMGALPGIHTLFPRIAPPVELKREGSHLFQTLPTKARIWCGSGLAQSP